MNLYLKITKRKINKCWTFHHFSTFRISRYDKGGILRITQYFRISVKNEKSSLLLWQHTAENNWCYP